MYKGGGGPLQQLHEINAGNLFCDNIHALSPLCPIVCMTKDTSNNGTATCCVCTCKCAQFIWQCKDAMTQLEIGN